MSQIAKKKFPHAMLLGGLSVNLNHLKIKGFGGPQGQGGGGGNAVSYEGVTVGAT